MATEHLTYWSLGEYVDAAVKHVTAKTRDDHRDEWCGGTDWDGAVGMGRQGWSDELDSTLELAESAVTMADKDHMTDSFNDPVWDVTGSSVDVGAYLAGTPECMVDYPLTVTSKVGRVITLCAPDRSHRKRSNGAGGAWRR